MVKNGGIMILGGKFDKAYGKLSALILLITGLLYMFPTQIIGVVVFLGILNIVCTLVAVYQLKCSDKGLMDYKNSVTNESISFLKNECSYSLSTLTYLGTLIGLVILFVSIVGCAGILSVFSGLFLLGMFLEIYFVVVEYFVVVRNARFLSAKTMVDKFSNNWK